MEEDTEQDTEQAEETIDISANVANDAQPAESPQVSDQPISQEVQEPSTQETRTHAEIEPVGAEDENRRSDKVEPIGITPLKSADEDDFLASTNLPKSIFLEFDAIQSEPPVEKIFLATGGSIAAAASRASTDFAVSGSKVSTVAELSDTYASTVRIELSPDHFSVSEDEDMTIVMSNRAKFLACTSRSGAAINGSIVTTISGQGGTYLSKLLKNGLSAVAVPLTYASWQAHSAVITASNFKLVDEKERHYSIRFKKDEKRDEILKAAEVVLSSWADGAWEMRQSVLPYPYSPSLTKCVARVPIGISDTGYSLVHDIAEPVSSEFSYKTINSLLKHGINVDLEFVQEDVDAFLEDAKVPGLKAAKNGARSVAAAMSVIANFLISYRADGRTSVMPTGSVAVSAESWLRQSARVIGIEANDCDGSCLAINSILSFVVSAPLKVREKYPFINAVYNVLVPHYQYGVSVLGASSAEASGGGKREKHAGPKKVAGHAVALLMPTTSILLGLERGSYHTINGSSIVESGSQQSIADARFEAMFPPSVVGKMPEDEQSAFSNWESAKDTINTVTLEPFAMEGTTPASPIMFREGESAETARETSMNDEKAFSKVGSNIGRSIKILYAGGDKGEPLHHMFYSEFVELTFQRSNSLWTNEKLRDLGAACTQVVFSKHSGQQMSEAIQMAGSTPEEIVKYKFALVPLVVSDTETADVLDFASSLSDADVMPPRPQKAQVLSEFQSTQLTQSLKHLEALNESFKRKMSQPYEAEAANGHAVAYIIAFSTLVNNPLAVRHMVQRLESVAVSGVVDAMDVEGMMADSSGREAGKLVVINAVVEV